MQTMQEQVYPHVLNCDQNDVIAVTSLFVLVNVVYMCNVQKPVKFTVVYDTTLQMTGHLASCVDVYTHTLNIHNTENVRCYFSTIT